MQEKATLGGGCFWCLEAAYQCLKGVDSVISGYAGGTLAYPLYEQVCMGTTGHAEVVQITFDPAVITYEDILSVFWCIHNPTTRNRQGHDSGTQYRSIIFYHSEEQRRVAESSLQDAEASGAWSGPIVTEIVPYTAFYPADGRHQNYFRSHPEEAYCQVVIEPKVAKLRKAFQEKLKK
ncbi:MAG: peptide-methionine (S)-S-oxide reductase [Deltaproteobacteria bacterium]|nr:peptide-methionine (S)-S-oxide reductase [Deltaproteobacteria bacterium]TLN01588.1 MAG: peptide-methionine (S)-S-oxide reductase MsrA [bacterium]